MKRHEFITLIVGAAQESRILQYVPVVTFLSWLFDSESARGFVDQVLVKQRNAQVVEIGLP
jgi:hypothetical protein